MKMSVTSIDDNQDQYKDLFTQDGVLLKACLGRPITELNSIGMLCIMEQPNNVKCIEWRPNDLITIESDTQDQDWAVVNTVDRRQRTLSGNYTSDYATAKSRTINIPLSELKTFKVTRNNQQMQLSTKSGVWQTTFYFQHGNAEIFVANLKVHVKTAKARHDRNVYIVMESNPETEVLNRSFAELDIYPENTSDVVSGLVSNFKQRPAATALELFSKLTDIVYYGSEETNGKRDVSEEVADLLTKSMTAMEENTIITKTDEYEVVNVKTKLPPRPDIRRSSPLSDEQWEGLQDPEGRVTEVEGVKQLIFRGGIAHSIRPKVWKYLLNYYPWHMTTSELKAHKRKKTEEYYTMKLQWKSMTEGQENRFSEYRDRKSLVEKDVNRTDRTHPFYAGDNNPNLAILSDILMTYVMYNFDLGYVQGMSDILAPILLLLENEVDSFWCFVGFMDKIEANFDIDQAGMKLQLLNLWQLMTVTSSELAQYLSQKDSANMYFCFRWLLVWFKREFSLPDIMRLWEVLWTGLPCANFHLLICAAILDIEKEVLMTRGYGFTEILKHVNDLSMTMDVSKVLTTAEQIYHQLTSSNEMTDPIRIILGMEPLNKSTISSNGEGEPSTLNGNQDGATDKENGGLYGSEADEVMYQIGLDMNF